MKFLHYCALMLMLISRHATHAMETRESMENILYYSQPLVDCCLQKPSPETQERHDLLKNKITALMHEIHIVLTDTGNAALAKSPPSSRCFTRFSIKVPKTPGMKSKVEIYELPQGVPERFKGASAAIAMNAGLQLTKLAHAYADILDVQRNNEHVITLEFNFCQDESSQATTEIDAYLEKSLLDTCES